MIKKLSMTLLLIGALVMTAGFSSNSTLYAKQHVQSNNFQYVSTDKFSESTIQELMEKCFGNANVEVEKQPEQNENQKEVEQPEKEQTPAEEQPEEEHSENNNENEASAEVPVEEEETQQETPAKEDNAQENIEEQEQTTENNQNADISEFEQEVVALTNEERQKQGLPALEIDAELSKVAKQKSEDMATNGYFSHNSPTYGSPFDMIQQAGIDYRTAGENIAKGQQTPEEVVNAWMNSEGHRANILNENFTHIGVGYVEQGNHWTQQFIGK
ncbi:CAP domain-containing protein [Gracilibacillus saliphilus]|uniref:CAP domain-containing protein n=1 Tax=Gracilibacillus saliphilus TaxID=543890 RepID=UPI0013D3EC6D|nr:CAP domain-containing protein [Gracilibacillus saliphilus]